uniref:Uncharacterized protein n=1 Tax=Arundo donax TaxID=35708 RepID=A0A0A9ATN6_ARUDO
MDDGSAYALTIWPVCQIELEHYIFYVSFAYACMHACAWQGLRAADSCTLSYQVVLASSVGAEFVLHCLCVSIGFNFGVVVGSVFVCRSE